MREEVRNGLRPLFPRIWRYCLALTGSRDRANDLAQAACLHALEKAHLYEPGTHLDRWMFRMTHRLWLNDLRSEAVRRGQGLLPIEDIDLPDDKSDPQTNFFAKQVLTEVMRLPDAHRNVENFRRFPVAVAFHIDQHNGCPLGIGQSHHFS